MRKKYSTVQNTERKLIKEFTSPILFGFLCGYIIASAWEISTVIILRAGRYAHEGGWHFHHSILALFSLLTIPLLQKDRNKTLFIIGFALGIYAQHIPTEKTLEKGFMIVEKDEEKQLV